MILVNNRNTNNPFCNLALEEWLVRHYTVNQEDLLLLYINDPCIVLGKNQSIYQEVNFEALRNGSLLIARRISGGGTVYHDKGNLNFSFISRFEDFKINNYRHFNHPVIHALQKAGVAAEIDGRNNMVAQGKKISGNSQFTDRKNLLSHGTLLVDADLSVLGHALKKNDFRIETKAVASVRSEVMNIAELSDKLKSADMMKSYLIEELPISDELKLTAEQWKCVEEMAVRKFQSYEWIYGRSPFTIIRNAEWEIEVENGIITRIAEKQSSQNQVRERLVGIRYSFVEIKKALEIFPNAKELARTVF